MGWGKLREAEAGLLSLLHDFPFSNRNSVASQRYSPSVAAGTVEAPHWENMHGEPADN